MRHATPTLLLAALMSGLGAPPATAQAGGGAMEKMHATAADAVAWADADVPGFPAGMRIAVISGNTAEAGPYTLRLSFPDGYRFPSHWHPMDENVTVLSGTIRLAMGETVDDSKLKSYGAGSFLHILAKHPHFGGAQGFTVLQLHGEGPFSINLAGQASK